MRAAFIWWSVASVAGLIVFALGGGFGGMALAVLAVAAVGAAVGVRFN